MTTQSDVKPEVSVFGDVANKRLRPMPREYTTLDVSLDLTSLVLATYIDELYAAMETELATQTGQRQMLFSQGDLRDYCWILVYERVAYVRGDQRPRLRYSDVFVVPAFLSVVLAQLGRAEEPSLGLVLMPGLPSQVGVNGNKWTFKAEESTMARERDMDWFMRVSRVLTSFSKFGFEYAYGYDRAKSGSFEFMAMSVLQDHVMHHTDSTHPVYALLASVLSLRGAESALSPRVDYGDINEMRNLVRAFAVPKPYFTAND